MSTQNEVLSQLVADVQSASDDVVVKAARELLALREFGDPPGTFLLLGGKAALRLNKTADAVVLLYHAVRVSTPGTLVWAEILVNRALACGRHGCYPDAIAAGRTFLDALSALPVGAAKWEPYAHHAIAQAADRMGDYRTGAYHHRLAMEGFSDSAAKAKCAFNLAYSLTLGGDPGQAEAVLDHVDIQSAADITKFGFWGTTCIIRHHQGRYSEALEAGDRVDSLARGHEDEWAVPLAEFHYWMSKSAWEVGDRYRAAALALHVAVQADIQWNIALCQAATGWLAEMMDKGGVQGA